MVLPLFHEASGPHPRPLAPAPAHRSRRGCSATSGKHGLLDEEVTRSMLDWQGAGGFSIEASVRIEGHDRAGIERLVRYCARPPFALGRLHAPDGLASLADPDARLLYEVPARHDRAERGEVLSRIARLVPPPRIHRHRYHGVLAPNARLRAQVVTIGRPDAEAAEAQAPHDAARGEAGSGRGSRGPPLGRTGIGRRRRGPSRSAAAASSRSIAPAPAASAGLSSSHASSRCCPSSAPRAADP